MLSDNTKAHVPRFHLSTLTSERNRCSQNRVKSCKGNDRVAKSEVFPYGILKVICENRVLFLNLFSSIKSVQTNVPELRTVDIMFCYFIFGNNKKKYNSK